MQEIKKRVYKYVFENGEVNHMTPVEAMKYSYNHKTKILHGPNIENHKPVERYIGWGWCHELGMNFKGPAEYKAYLKANKIEIWDQENPPQFTEESPPVWTEELIRKTVQEHKVEIGSVLAEALLSGELDFPQ